MNSAATRRGTQLKPQTAAVLVAQAKAARSTRELLGTSECRIRECMLSLIDDGLLHDIDVALNRQNTVLKVTADVLEIFTTVERVKKRAEASGLSTMQSISLETGFDLKRKDTQNKVLRKIFEEKPYLVIMAFPCTLWSLLQNLTRHKRDLEGLREEERKLLNFVKVVCKLQMKQGRHFLLENPLGSQAWQEEHIQAILQMPGVHSVRADMCAYGKRAEENGELVKKPTRFVSDSPLILRGLARRCCGGHKHADFHTLRNTAKTG